MRVIIFVLIVILSWASSSALYQIYKLSARGLPAGKNVFAEVNKHINLPSKCRTESIRGSNPVWKKECVYQGDQPSTSFRIETRNDRSGAQDQSIGWSEFFVGSWEFGETYHALIRGDNGIIGNMTLHVK